MEGDKISKDELKIRLRELQNQYDLTHRAMDLGCLGMVLVTGLLLLAVHFGGIQTLEGKHVVMIVGIIAAAIIVYFSFVFRRAAKVGMEISKTKAQLKIESGKRV